MDILPSGYGFAHVYNRESNSVDASTAEEYLYLYEALMFLISRQIIVNGTSPHGMGHFVDEGHERVRTKNHVKTVFAHVHTHAHR